MKRLQFGMFLLCLCAVLVAMSAPVLAQDGNLLTDPGMEGEYTNRGRADLNVPAGWGLTIIESPRTEDWMNLQPVAFPHLGPGPNPHSGAKALNFNRGYATFTVVVYQTVPFAQGTNVTASAWAQLKTCNIPTGSDNCTSSGEGGAFTRVGIDPNGGNNVFDGDIVWSANAAPHNTWGQMTTTATTTGPAATIFLYVTQNFPTQLNNVYWDDAYFGTGGAGGAAPPVPGQATATPIPPAEVPFVIPQNARPDGSVVHIVGPGDTLDSIAVAYGMTRAEILEVNPQIGDARYILIGQEIIIEPPGSIGGFGNEPSVESTAEVGGETGVIPEVPAGSGFVETVPNMSGTVMRGSRLFYYFRPQFNPANVGSDPNGVEVAMAETPSNFNSAPADATTTASDSSAVDSAGAVVPTTTPSSLEVAVAENVAPSPSPSPNSGRGDSTTTPEVTDEAVVEPTLVPSETATEERLEATPSPSATVTMASESTDLSPSPSPNSERGASTPVESDDTAVSDQSGEANAEVTQPVEDTAVEVAMVQQITEIAPTSTPSDLREPVSQPDSAPAPVNSVGSGDVAPAFDPASANAAVCVILFNDLNLNRIQEVGEDVMSGATIQITDGTTVVREVMTDGSEPRCFTDLPAADYIARATAPEGFGMTTPEQFVIRAAAGVPVNVEFGAAVGVIPAQAPTPDTLADQVVDEPDTVANPILDNLGWIVVGAAAVVLVLGVGVTLLLRRR